MLKAGSVTFTGGMINYHEERCALPQNIYFFTTSFVVSQEHAHIEALPLIVCNIPITTSR